MLDDDARLQLEAAYRQMGPDLWRAILAYSGGIREVADEAVAESFAQAGRGFGRIRQLKPWLYRAAFRIAAGELGRRRRDAPLAGFDRAAPPEGGVMPALAGLSPNQRAAFVLREVFGYSGAEAAELIGISDVAVRVHLHAARRRLRAQLEEEERV